MNISYLVQKRKSHSKFFLSLLLVIFFTHSCSSPAKHTFFEKAEKDRYEEFFKRFLFLDSGVYTLYGSKPMTEIILCPESPEEKLALQEEALKKLSPEELEQFKASSFEYEENYWFEETWAMWEKQLATLPIKRYLFVERKIGIPPESQKNRYIYFINIEETAKVLQSHYHLFKEYVGFDFDPLSVVFEVKKADSPFWNAIWDRPITDKNVCLIGILFGFGFENSYPFSWYFTENPSVEKTAFIQTVLNGASSTTTPKELKQFHPPNCFFLPGYASFSQFDPHKEKYQKEYERIRQIYRHSDLIDCTMQQLLR